MKDFDEWNKKKKLINNKDVELYYHTREVWWCYIGVNVGTEQDGSEIKFLRPVVIMRGFGPDACLVLPLTTSKRKHYLRFDIGLVDGKKAKANLSQMRVIDTNRLLEKVGVVEKSVFYKLRKTVRDLF